MYIGVVSVYMQYMVYMVYMVYVVYMVYMVYNCVYYYDTPTLAATGGGQGVPPGHMITPSPGHIPKG
jgi:hypothetical protein